MVSSPMGKYRPEKEEQVAEPDTPGEPEGAPQGDQKDGLQFEGKGGGQQEQGGRGLSLQSGDKGVEEEGGVDAVALAPTGTVQYHGGQQKNGAEGEEGGVALPLKMPDQPEPAPGQEHVEENGKELDSVEIMEGKVGKGGHKVKIRYIIIAHRQIQGGKTAVFPEKSGPLFQENLIILALVVKEEGPEKEGQGQGEKGPEQGRAPVALPAQKAGGQEEEQAEQSTHSNSAPREREAAGRKSRTRRNRPPAAQTYSE